MNPPLVESNIPDVPVRRGKVRDVYDFDDRLLIIATDRISAFDWVLPTGIPDKGRILTQISLMWFQLLGETNHLISDDPRDVPLPDSVDITPLIGRSMVVRKTNVVPIECVARGYLAGSGWKEYSANGQVCGVPLPPRLRESSKLPSPIFTPATKAESGHDENISFETMCQTVDPALAEELKERTLRIYLKAAEYARSRGIIIADTKFEFGLVDNELILIDEVLTPDSSRFWPADDYEPGRAQASYDKQFVRDWLAASAWDKNSPPPELPHEIVRGTRRKYAEAYELLVGKPFPLDDEE
ncbi:phosphoribosylaminoimidazolesuccinocarboxamide synthase [Calycomorphotria hydatis]|uniref:Phosphoribosylaminoimidazole-succinocarboxamide synthase n=1 Tax=Calycomorphotria hydatis TaxID=2528027 RepID=A0A517TBP5_9PLAN|nr:phosphoribosylaminoimidazolesuccinocarboxamide synthase [Calycomorphotria hydatis]QDT65795.1 Phosphoribosylaminoimidazole-succinocarboxamide synthase [Calycomorphotria hydatis]